MPLRLSHVNLPEMGTLQIIAGSALASVLCLGCSREPAKLRRATNVMLPFQQDLCLESTTRQGDTQEIVARHPVFGKVWLLSATHPSRQTTSKYTTPPPSTSNAVATLGKAFDLDSGTLSLQSVEFRELDGQPPVEMILRYELSAEGIQDERLKICGLAQPALTPICSASIVVSRQSPDSPSWTGEVVFPEPGLMEYRVVGVTRKLLVRIPWEEPRSCDGC